MNKRNARLLWPALLISWLIAASPAGAAPLSHPAPSVLHDYIVSLTPNTLTVGSFLRVSPELALEVYRQIDTNGDGKTSEAEREAWTRTHPSKFKIQLDGVEQKSTMSQVPSISKEDMLVSISEPIAITYTVSLASPVEGKHRIILTYGDNYLTYDEYYVSVANDIANDPTPRDISRNQYPATIQLVYQMPPANYANPVPEGKLAPAPYSAALNNTNANSQPGVQFGSLGSLLDALRGWRGETGAALGFLLLAMLLGALHALTPGHGKTMVAAYLIGSRGRVRDAVTLGGVVTITHTAGVIVLGVALLVVSNFTVPRALMPALQLISGVLVVILGGYLLLSRLRAKAAPEPARAKTGKVGVTTTPALSAASVGVRTRQTASVTMPQARTSLATRRAQGTQAQNRQNYIHVHRNGHNHDHDHSHLPPVGKRTLLGLGVSGGLVPCPEALAIVLLAASIGQFALGVGLVVAFSVGLAAMLIGIGVALVKMRGILEKSRVASLSPNALWTKWVPIASAAIVVAVGILMVGAALTSKWS